MRTIHRVVLLTALAISTCGLTACSGGFDPDKLDIFGLSEKKKLPGERKDVFPGGVPGVSQGIPPELMKGNQPLSETAQAPAPAQAKSAAAVAGEEEKDATTEPEEKPKPKPKPKKVAKPKPQPQPAQDTAQSSAWPQQQQAQPAQQSGQSAWPAPAQTNTASPWPSSPQPGSFQR
jgi:hypothetical protein